MYVLQYTYTKDVPGNKPGEPLSRKRGDKIYPRLVSCNDDDPNDIEYAEFVNDPYDASKFGTKERAADWRNWVLEVHEVPCKIVKLEDY